MLENDKWELYNTDEDFSLANDLASSNPSKLKTMQDLFLQEAIKNHVLPIDDRGVERLNPVLAGRPDLMAGRTSLTVYSGMTGMMESAFINIKNRSYSITADVQVPKKNANGVIICQGGRFGGWTLFLKNGRPTFTYNWVGLSRYTISGKQPVPRGEGNDSVRVRNRRRQVGRRRNWLNLRKRRKSRNGPNRKYQRSFILSG